MLLIGAQGASAQTVSPEGIGIEATGPILTVTPTPDATAANPGPANTASVGIPGILTANVISAAVNGNTTTAGVAGLTALGTLGITAGAISSTCTANADGTFTRRADLADLAITGLTIPVNPGPNTTLGIPGVLSVTLNQRVAGPVTGSVTVNALVITALGETITIGSSTCGPYVAGAPIAGGKGLALGGGVVAAAGAGIAAVKLNRRRRTNGA